MTTRTPKTDRLLAELQSGVTLTPAAIRHQFGLVDSYSAVRRLRARGFAIYGNPTKRGRSTKVTYRLGTPNRAMVSAAYALGEIGR